jgi:hypothetical protein
MAPAPDAPRAAGAHQKDLTMTPLDPSALHEIAGGTTQQELIDFFERVRRDMQREWAYVTPVPLPTF